eukprot:scaffold4233_cov153-Pinguiococcus_pyrenoidosus.AAC.1
MPTAKECLPHSQALPSHAAQTAAPQLVRPGSRAGLFSSPHPPREAGSASWSSGASARCNSRPGYSSQGSARRRRRSRFAQPSP